MRKSAPFAQSQKHFWRNDDAFTTQYPPSSSSSELLDMGLDMGLVEEEKKKRIGEVWRCQRSVAHTWRRANTGNKQVNLKHLAARKQAIELLDMGLDIMGLDMGLVEEEKKKRIGEVWRCQRSVAHTWRRANTGNKQVNLKHLAARKQAINR